MEELIQIVKTKLSDFNSFRRTNKIIQKNKNENTDETQWSEVYKLTDDLYIELYITEDSYEANEWVTGLAFVKPKEVSHITFEKI